MRFKIREGIPGLAPSRARRLQLAACALAAWAWWRPDAEVVSPSALASSAHEAAEKSDAPTTRQSDVPPVMTPDPLQTAPQAAGLGFSTIEVIVGRNDTLDRIFRRLQLNLADLASLRGLPGLKAQLDRLRPGEALRLMHREGELIGFERKLSPSETLKVMRESSGFLADVMENPLETEVRTVRGVIDSSLFEAVTAAGAHDQTALALADIFAWDIDFVLDIQRGDSFIVTYEEHSQDGEYVQDGAVLAASFINQGREYRAVRYLDAQGRAAYYSPDGRSMRRAFLRAPLEFTRVSSGFNLRRRHPVLNRIRAHKGVDYAAPTGTPVRAAGDGRIQFAGRKGGYGNVVEIAHAGGIVTLYGHLSRFAKSARTGTRVAQGDPIGFVGMTGLASGPHLHYEYLLRGVHKNPQTVRLPDSISIDPALREDFLARTAPLLASLEVAYGLELVSR
ncbi:MAG TPA: peptidoglycan DD-metalloendopeptidase family protein [Steroidobacteraceae bacterium]|nr:peptidoglycan DD-metalloendopeptidase family protein [Steroidobacteraceae bacterium]